MLSLFSDYRVLGLRPGFSGLRSLVAFSSWSMNRVRLRAHLAVWPREPTGLGVISQCVGVSVRVYHLPLPHPRTLDGRVEPGVICFLTTREGAHTRAHQYLH